MQKSPALCLAPFASAHLCSQAMGETQHQVATT